MRSQSRARDAKSLNCPWYLLLSVEALCTRGSVWERRGDVLYQVNCLSHCYKGCLFAGEIAFDVGLCFGFLKVS